MKKLFFALALTAFAGTAVVTTAAAMTHSKIVLKGDKDDKKKKDKTCKSSDAKCSKGDKKCCHSKTKATSEEKTDQKKADQK